MNCCSQEYGQAFGCGTYIVCFGGGDAYNLTMQLYYPVAGFYIIDHCGIIAVIIGGSGASVSASVHTMQGAASASAEVSYIAATATASEYWLLKIHFNYYNHRAAILAGSGPASNLVTGCSWS